MSYVKKLEANEYSETRKEAIKEIEESNTKRDRSLALEKKGDREITAKLNSETKNEIKLEVKMTEKVKSSITLKDLLKLLEKKNSKIFTVEDLSVKVQLKYIEKNVKK